MLNLTDAVSKLEKEFPGIFTAPMVKKALELLKAELMKA